MYHIENALNKVGITIKFNDNVNRLLDNQIENVFTRTDSDDAQSTREGQLRFQFVFSRFAFFPF